MEAIVAAALASGCDAVHPGYGFLSEVPEFAEACAGAGTNPSSDPRPRCCVTLATRHLVGAIAERCGVPVLRGSAGAATLEDAKRLLGELGTGGVMIKAVAGGGGRGMRMVSDPADLASGLGALSL